MEKLRTVIIGCGSIGALRDLEEPADNNKITTHCHAIKYLSSKFELIGVIDQEEEKARKAGEKWGVRWFTGQEEILRLKPDIVVIATPDNTHREIAEFVCRQHFFRPKLIVLEKPAGKSRDDCLAIKALSHVHKIPIMVNYSRMFNRWHYDFKQQIVDKDYGELINVVVRYGRGLRRDGCHSLQLLNYLLDGFIAGMKLPGGIIDRDKDDPTYAVHMMFNRCEQVFMVPTDGRVGACFTHDFWFERQRIVIEDYGARIEHYTRSKDGIYGSYLKMNSKPEFEFINQDFTHNLTNLYENIYNYFDNDIELRSTIEDAVNVWEILNNLIGRKK